MSATRTPISREVWAVLPRRKCPDCKGTQGIEADTTAIAGQLVKVKHYGEWKEAEVYWASEEHASFTLISAKGKSRPEWWETGTAGRSSAYFDPIPFVTAAEDERWCVCGDRAVPF